MSAVLNSKVLYRDTARPSATEARRETASSDEAKPAPQRDPRQEARSVLKRFPQLMARLAE